MIKETIATEINVSICNKVNPHSANGNRMLSQIKALLIETKLVIENGKFIKISVEPEYESIRNYSTLRSNTNLLYLSTRHTSKAACMLCGVS